MRGKSEGEKQGERKHDMEKDTEKESGSDNSDFMDNVNVDGGDKNSMSENPKKLFEKYLEKPKIQILQKLLVWKAQKLIEMHLQKGWRKDTTK